MNNKAIPDSLRAELYKNITDGLNSPVELKQTMQWLEELRALTTIFCEKIALAQIMQVLRGANDINDNSIKDFVICVKTILHEREIRGWTQPLMINQKVEICALVIKKSGNSFYCLVQALEEPGIINGFQIGPTVQTGILAGPDSLKNQPYLKLFENPSANQLVFDVVLSYEGGRFFKNTKRYLAILVSEGELDNDNPRYRWVSVATIKKLVAIPNTVNIFARTLLSILL